LTLTGNEIPCSRKLKFQLSTALLTVVTIASAIAAGVNYEQIKSSGYLTTGLFGQTAPPG